MKLRIWILYKNIKRTLIKIYHLPFFNFIRLTLTYHILKILAIIILLLEIIFKIAPHNAYINYQSDSTVALDSTALLCMMDLNTNKTEITFSDELYLNFPNQYIVVKKEMYDKDYSILIKPHIDHQAYMSIYGTNCNAFNLSLYSNDVTNDSHIYFHNIQDTTWINSSNGFNIHFEGETLWQTTYADVYLIKNTNEIIPIDSFSIIPINDERYTANIDNAAHINILNYSDNYIYSKADIVLCGIKQINAQTTGNLNFSYIPNPQTYDLNNQQLYFEGNSDLMTKITIDTSKKNLSITGHIIMGTIADMNLFPTIKGWFQSNIYTIPLTLITTIFGGIAIVNKRKKQ